MDTTNGGNSDMADTLTEEELRYLAELIKKCGGYVVMSAVMDLDAETPTDNAHIEGEDAPDVE